MAIGTNVMRLWLWPLEAARAAEKVMETALATQIVVAARLPIIASAAANLPSADYRELTLMVSEKASAFGKSGDAVAQVVAVIQKATDANARTLGKAASGGMVAPIEWFAMFERNVAISAAIMDLPMQALAPIHEGVTSNARRLRSV